MRARLNTMEQGATFTFLCLPIMADQMQAAITQNGGGLHAKDERNYGVVMTAVKLRSSLQLPGFFPKG